MTTKDIESALQSAKIEVDSKILTEIKISGFSDDSRKIKENFVFVAIKGANRDGNNFIDTAISNGCKVVVTENRISNIKNLKVNLIQVTDARKALSVLASFWYGDPSKKLKVVGITGTKGKTTVTHLAYHILKNAGFKVGMVSTVKAQIGELAYDTGFHVTNPEPLVLQKYLKEMVDMRLEIALIEVTSHGLDQERVFGIDFEMGVLTNIAKEHLDYHKTFEKYRKAKYKLFENSKYAVLNLDDISSKPITKMFSDSNVLTYSQNKNGDLNGSIVKIDSYMYFEISGFGSKHKGKIQLPGKYNLSNILAAVSIAKHFGVKINDSLKYLVDFEPPEGRLEKVKNDRGLNIYIDFAHTPDSLENLLSLLSTMKNDGRLICIFGCAGERDPKKRYQMGKISGKIADITVITAEDPRSEDVLKIINQIKRGVLASGTRQYLKEPEKGNIVKGKRYYVVVPDRSEAIYYTIGSIAQKGDILVFCGKGHEKSMCYGDIEHPWSDREEILSSLKVPKGKTAVILGAGKGKRLNSDLPKVIHKIAGKPMISFTINNLRRAGYSEIIVVIGYRGDLVKKELGPTVDYALQRHQLGTGHSAWQGIKKVKVNKPVLVVNGDDSAFYTPKTYKEIYFKHEKNGLLMSNTSTILDDPTGNGRLVRDGNGKLFRIVEEKVATDKEKKIKESNLNMYVFERDWFLKNIRKVKKAQVGEYYITDMVEIAISQKARSQVFVLKDPLEWCGVNTPEQLKIADERMRAKLRIRI